MIRRVPLLARDVPGRCPLGRGPGLDVGLAVHAVDVLEAEGAGLVEEEPDDDGPQKVAADKDPAVVVRDGVCRDGAEEGDED